MTPLSPEEKPEERKRFWVTVRGPRIRGDKDVGGRLEVLTAPTEAREYPDGRRSKARPPTLVAFAAGEWTEYEVGEILPREGEQ